MEVKASVKFCNDLGDAKAYEIPERDTTKRRFEKLMEEYKESVEVAEKARQKYQHLVIYKLFELLLICILVQ